MRWLRAQDPRQRLRQQRSLLASGACVVAIGIIAYGLHAGFVPPAPGRWLLLYLTAGLAGFFAVLRSGLNLRFSDPALTGAQTAFAVTGMIAAYGISGPVRGGFLMLLACAMAFGGFAPKRSHTRHACLLSLALLAAVMTVSAWLDPRRYEVRTEVIHFILCAVALPTIAGVAGQLHGVRARLKARNRELGEALERIHRQATRDELTGLANRRLLLQCLDAEGVRMQRNARACCVCMIDLDFFKRINDRHGHAAGDAVLKTFAAVATATARQSDALGRWGGEEFLWLLPGTEVADANAAVERLRAAFADAPAWRHRPELRSTFSAGLAQLHPLERPQQALERADTALYLAKTNGRNGTAFVARLATHMPAAVEVHG